MAALIFIRLGIGLARASKQAARAGPVFGPIIKRVGRKAQFKLAGKRLARSAIISSVATQVFDLDDLFDKQVANRLGLKTTDEIVDIIVRSNARALLFNPVKGTELLFRDPGKFFFNVLERKVEFAKGVGARGIPAAVLFVPETRIKAAGRTIGGKFGEFIEEAADFVF